MKKIFFIIILILIMIDLNNQASTDCVKNAGKDGKECKTHSTFVFLEEYNFVYEEDQNYVCCFYKGKVGNLDYEGCFPFFEDFIINNQVNNLLDDMEKGKWELALNVPCNNPSIDCFSKKVDLNIKIFFIILFFYIMI